MMGRTEKGNDENDKKNNRNLSNDSVDYNFFSGNWNNLRK